MNRRDFIRAVSTLLRDSSARKVVSMPKQTFTITDDLGNARSFQVKKSEKKVLYTIEDVEQIVDACIYVIQDSLKRGESVSFHGFGTLGLKYRKPRSTKMIGSNENIDIEGRYIPKFQFGNDLRTCAKIYELSLEDKLAGFVPEYFDDDEDEETKDSEE